MFGLQSKRLRPLAPALVREKARADGDPGPALVAALVPSMLRTVDGTVFLPAVEGYIQL
jgi:hypothetical protein